jgi:LPXTG-motif cell wall-anchored protein
VPSPGPGVLPATGGDAGVLVWVVLLTLLGGALVVAGRRRVIDC